MLRMYVHLEKDQREIAFRQFSEGTLTLVDLAGSEHKIDSMYHSADRRKEGMTSAHALCCLLLDRHLIGCS